MWLSLKTRTLPIAILLLLAASPLHAETSCQDKFAGREPEIVNPRLTAKTRELCFQAYAVLHSGVARTPLWSAEKLTRAGIAQAHRTAREDSFHPEMSLPASERAELSDYARSGYDRGHMSPAGDMPDEEAMHESFSLANMVPQNPNNNRNLWAHIEAAARGMATHYGEIYVVSGVIYDGDRLDILHGRVLVPTRLFKAVYVPSLGEAGAWIVKNAPGDAWQAVSMDELRGISGIDPFPDLSPAVKSSVMPLPAPLRRETAYK